MTPTRVAVKWQCADVLCDHVECLEHAAYTQSDLHETKMSVARRPGNNVWDWSVVVQIDGHKRSESEAKKTAEQIARRLLSALKPQ